MAGWDDIPNAKPKDGWDDIPNIIPTQPTLPISISTQPKTYSLGQIPGEALSNIPGGLLDYAKTLVNPSTYQSLGELAQSVNPAYWPQEFLLKGKYPLETAFKTGEALAQQKTESYGGWENIKRTIAERPIEPLSDLASLLMGGGALLPKTGQMGQVANIAGKTGQWLDPLSATGKVLEATGGLLKKAGAGPLGITTTIGTRSVEKAMEGGAAFRQSLRGKIAAEEIAESAKGGVYAVRQEMANTYKQRLTDIKNLPNAPQMDIVPSVKEFYKTMKGYNVEVVQGKGGKYELDFARSSIKNNQLAQNDFTKVMDTLQDALKDQSYFTTPEGFDILKRQLYDMYKESSEGRVVVERVANDVRKQLIQRVPGYEKMVGDYEKTSNLIKEIERGLSLGKKSSVDTALRKLNSAMKEDDNFRRNLIAKVEDTSGKDISGMVSGRMMRGVWPKGFRGTEIAGVAVIGSIFGHPGLLPLIAVASPRIVAETMMLLGKAEKYGTKAITPTTAPIRQGIYQLGSTMEE